MPNFAFCQTCGDRIPLGSADHIRKYCGLHATAEGRAKHAKDQAALVKEREEQQHAQKA